MTAHTLHYKGYEGSIDVSVEDGVLHGQVLFINDVVTYEGETVSELQRSFQSAVDDYLELCERTGTKPDRPFRGSFNVRVTAELHREAAVRAKREDCSLNDIVYRALYEYLHPTPTVQMVRHLAAFQFDLTAEREESLYGITPRVTLQRPSRMAN